LMVSTIFRTISSIVSGSISSLAFSVNRALLPTPPADPLKFNVLF